MPAVHMHFRSQNHRGGSRPESKALVVAISVLQLGFIAFVWLLALVPVALMAGGAMLLESLKSMPDKLLASVDS